MCCQNQLLNYFSCVKTTVNQSSEVQLYQAESSNHEAACQSETISQQPVFTHSINTSTAVNPIPSLRPLINLSILRSTDPLPLSDHQSAVHTHFIIIEMVFCITLHYLVIADYWLLWPQFLCTYNETTLLRWCKLYYMMY